jgi:hypothetical protein
MKRLPYSIRLFETFPKLMFLIFKQLPTLSWFGLAYEGGRVGSNTCWANQNLTRAGHKIWARIHPEGH